MQPHRFFPIVLCSLVAATLAVVPRAVSSTDLVAQTASGAVQGIADGPVNEWRGIPYAASPVGALRWRPPAPVSAWSGVRDATEFASPCIQLAPEGTLGSEDCLYLNVFAPGTATPSSRLAVMVHLHPGRNAFGDAYTDAGAFTARNVIVVTVGYRLGVFGFVGHPALTAEGGGSSGEYGVLDQLAALRWVHDNIAAFGGDPSRVTLFGSSAGSFDTVALMASPRSQGLIARAAVQGEFLPYLTGQFNAISDAEQIGPQVAQSVGCQSSSDVLECLRATPAPALVAAAANGPEDFGPWVGGLVLPTSPIEFLSDRATVPLLIGIDREENAFWEIDPQTDSLFSPYQTDHWVRDTNSFVGPNRGVQARALYPPSSYDSLLWSFITMTTDGMRGCPVRRMANTVVAHAPVWRYLYTHTIETNPYLAQFRANHYFEEPLLWGPGIFGPDFVLSPAEQLLSQRMTDYWTNFAKTGDPNGSGLPNWPAYNAVSEPTLTLDDQIGVVANYHDQQCAFFDALPNVFPLPWAHGVGPATFPPGFLFGHARAFP
jgi:para-nitrobenzyl esterase